MARRFCNFLGTSSFARRPFACCLALPLAVALFLSGRCEADWVSNSAGGMPFDAIVGGWDPDETQLLFLCRAHHVDDVQPGWALSGDSACHFSYGGLELTSTNFDWYVPSWAYSYGQSMPSNAIPLGGEAVAAGNAYRYPCRVNLTPGKYGPDLGGCFFPYGGVEHQQLSSGFSWLVDPGNNVNPPSAATLSHTPDDAILGPFLVGPYIIQDNNWWPPDAVVAGLDADGAKLYLCTAWFQNGWQPGKARLDWNACDVSWGGTEHYLSTAFSLVSPAFFDVQNSSDPFCANAFKPCLVHTNPIPVGTDTDGGTLYFCQVISPDGYTLPGKTKLGWGNACSYALHGVESYTSAVRVLTDGLLAPAVVL